MVYLDKMCRLKLQCIFPTALFNSIQRVDELILALCYVFKGENWLESFEARLKLVSENKASDEVPYKFRNG